MHYRSLQDRIVSEIESTYESIAAYKGRTHGFTKLPQDTATQRVQIIEHKLKSLKMMLAKIDDDSMTCGRCMQPVLKGKLSLKTFNIVCEKCAS